MGWVLDKAHSSVGFSIKHLMISTVRGKFTDFDAVLSLHDTDLTLSLNSLFRNSALLNIGNLLN